MCARRPHRFLLLLCNPQVRQVIPLIRPPSTQVQKSATHLGRLVAVLFCGLPTRSTMGPESVLVPFQFPPLCRAGVGDSWKKNNPPMGTAGAHKFR
ncbi:hypothetical protein FKM82_029800 [Ascaphus truei]